MKPADDFEEGLKKLYAGLYSADSEETVLMALVLLTKTLHEMLLISSEHQQPVNNTTMVVMEVLSTLVVAWDNARQTTIDWPARKRKLLEQLNQIGGHVLSIKRRACEQR